MIVIFDFHCESCNKTFEAMSERTDPKAKCPDCDKDAKRVLSVPNFHLDGTDPSFPGAYSKWARDHEKRGKVKR